jgi:hypothetical protein
MPVSPVAACEDQSKTRIERSGPAPVASVEARNGGDAGGKTASGIDRIPGRQVIVFDPIAVDDAPIADIAAELNRWAEGLGIPPSSILSRVAPTDRTPVPARRRGAWELVIESCQAAEGSSLHEIAAVAEKVLPVRNRLPDPSADLFEENPEGYEPSGEELASSAARESPDHAARPRFDPIELPADLAGGIAEELNRFAEGIGIRREETSSPIVRSPRFEPIESPMDTDTGIAYELNRRSEGLDLVLPGVGGTEPTARLRLTGRGSTGPAAGSSSQHSLQAQQPQPHSRRIRPPVGGNLQAKTATADASLDQAIRLTRDAAYAWMDVLKGPARVTMNWQ